jgi:hypothetical protein
MAISKALKLLFFVEDLGFGFQSDPTKQQLLLILPFLLSFPRFKVFNCVVVSLI